MEENRTKTCDNCKRDIPEANFLVHSIHCARNIRICPVCKEPVPQHELEEHHKRQHELLPCKECGEMVCGTDLDDHIRDSCAHTKRLCRYCELELPRQEIPNHENYCGSRTEQCPECLEWVQIKYKQLHLESNHGFIKLDDEPPPMPRINVPRPLSKTPSPRSAQSQNGTSPTASNNLNINGPSTSTQAIDNYLTRSSNQNQRTSPININTHNSSPYTSGQPNTLFTPFTSPNQRASSNNTTTHISPNRQNGPSRPDGVKRKIERSQNNNSHQLNGAGVAGPSTSAGPLRSPGNCPGFGGVRRKEGRPKKSPAPPPPPDPVRDRVLSSAIARRSREDHERDEINRINAQLGLPPVLSAAAKLEKLRKMDLLHNREQTRDVPDYRNVLQGRVWRNPDSGSTGGYILGRPQDAPLNLDGLTPMSEAEFLERLERLQTNETHRPSQDRFHQIKSGLTHLRRELNQVTAPYNANNATASNNARSNTEPVRLPCQFCEELVAEADFLKHEGECVGASGFTDIPEIPCEFCTESHPLYLIQEHQENCPKRNNRVTRESIDVSDG